MIHSFRRHWQINWPTITITLTILCGLSLFFGWYAFSQAAAEWWVISIVALLLLILMVFAHIWAYTQTSTILRQLPKWIVKRGRFSPEDQILFPYVSDSRIVPHVIQHLTTGKFWFIDVYSPADMRSAHTRRSRQQDFFPEKDTRLKFIPGNITLLPVQDGEIDVVILIDILNSITQFGDRRRFLAEVNRVLKPNGRILIVEPQKSVLKFLVDPTRFLQFWTKNQTIAQLNSSQFVRVEFQSIGELTIVGRAITPGRYENSQLPLEF